MLFMGPKEQSDQILSAAGIFSVPGITYRYYAESSYLDAAVQIAKMTEGASWLHTSYLPGGCSCEGPRERLRGARMQ